MSVYQIRVNFNKSNVKKQCQECGKEYELNYHADDDHVCNEEKWETHFTKKRVKNLKKKFGKNISLSIIN